MELDTAAGSCSAFLAAGIWGTAGLVGAATGLSATTAGFAGVEADFATRVLASLTGVGTGSAGEVTGLPEM